MWSRCTIVGLPFAFQSGDLLSAGSYYASPRGDGDGALPGRPFVIARFWEEAKPGETLILLDGMYVGRSSMMNPPKGLRGRRGAPITVRAMNDGKVAIDGQGKDRPIALCQNERYETGARIGPARSTTTAKRGTRRSSCAGSCSTAGVCSAI